MKTLKWILTILSGLLIVLLLAGILYTRHISRRAIPDYDNEVVLRGLKAGVQVYRDEWGIPHIYAGHYRDLYRATGYVMAQDRLWQMDLLRRVSQGRLSEILGEDMIEIDQLMRALRLEQKAESMARSSEPEILLALEAFADGINQYIFQAGQCLPFEFTLLRYRPEPWEGVQVMALAGYMSWSSSSGWRNETALYELAAQLDSARWMELIPDVSIQEPVLPDFRPVDNMPMAQQLLNADQMLDALGIRVFRGSNNWVISGELTRSGKPFLCNDMHLELNRAPGVWYQLHQCIPGVMNVSGVALPGTPFVDVGHNVSVAWGMTYVSNDDVDLYLETVHPKDSNRYLLDGEWKTMEVVKEKIGLPGGKQVVRYNRFTHRGPVVSTFTNHPEQVLSMRWIGHEASNEIQAIYRLNQAGNVFEAREALRSWYAISTNTAVADMRGNIGLFVNTGIPIREGNRALVMPGDTSLYDWKGLVPYEALPHAYNPPQGYLASANNRSAGADYPYHISHWYAIPNRYNRIVQMLEEGPPPPFELDYMEKMQTDQHSWWVRRVMAMAKPVLDTCPIVDRHLAAYDMIHDWDGTMDKDGVASSLFESFYLQLVGQIFSDELDSVQMELLLDRGTLVSGVMDRIVRGDSSVWTDDIRTGDRVETVYDLVTPAWRRAVEWMSHHYGEEMTAWKWGDLHALTISHPLGSVPLLGKLFSLQRGPYPVGGSSHTVCTYSWPLNRPFEINAGASQRHIFDLADWDDGRVIVPTGPSGIPASDFFCNQTELYLDHAYARSHFSLEKVAMHAAYRTTFHPGP